MIIGVDHAGSAELAREFGAEVSWLRAHSGFLSYRGDGDRPPRRSDPTGW